MKSIRKEFIVPDGRVFQAASETDCETAAYLYSDQGFDVLAVEPGSKRPARILKHGIKEATADEEVIAEWFRTNPDYSVAIVPKSANIVTVDLDGNEGIEDWKAMGFELDDSTPTTRTPGRNGGYHRYYAATAEQIEKIGGSSHIGKRNKVEVFADKYLVETPSPHPSGGRYEPMHSPELFAPLPDSIVEHITGKVVHTTSYGAPEPDVDCPYCPKVVEGVCDDVRHRVEGARNEYLWKSLMRVLGRPHLEDYGDAIEQIRAAYHSSHLPTDRKKKSKAEIDREFDGRLGSARKSMRAKGGFGRDDCPHRREVVVQDVSVTKADLDANRLQVVRFSDVQAVQRKMLWKRLIPEGAMTLISGAPGVGKSSFARWVACELVSGTLENGSETPSEGSVFWVTAEEAVESTVVPAIRAALTEKHQSADVDYYVGQVFGETIGEASQFAIDDGGDSLDRYLYAISQQPDTLPTRLIVVDSLDIFLTAEGADANSMQKMKRALAGLIKVAEKWGCSALMIDHFRKGEADRAMDKVAGSRAKTAMARSSLGMGYSPDHRDKRLVCLMKGSYADPHSTKAEQFWFTDGVCDVVTEDGLLEAQGQKFLSWSDSIRYDPNDVDRLYKYDDNGMVV